jgi:spermidine synthase
MGATLPALARGIDKTQDRVSWLGFFYGANIAGAVLGCLLAGFYLLRKYDVYAATYVAMAINVSTAALGLALAGFISSWCPTQPPSAVPGKSVTAVYLAISLSGLCALAAEAIWTRLLGLLFGASVYALSIIVVVFLVGLGIGSGIGALLCRTVVSPRMALGWCQWLAACAIAWTAYNLGAALPYWPINPAISSNICFNFELDLARAFWALLPPTLLWGASFPLALAAAASRGQDAARLMAGVYAAKHSRGHRRSYRREPAPSRLGGIAAHRTSAHCVIDHFWFDPSVPIESMGSPCGAAWRLLIPQRPADLESAHRVRTLRGNLGRQRRHRLRR